MVWLPLFLFTAATVSRFFMFRPQLFTFAFFALYVAILHRHLRTGRGALWLLPVVMLAWANTHGGFLAGFGAIGLALLAEELATTSLKRSHRSPHAASWHVAMWLARCGVHGDDVLDAQGVNLWAYVFTEVTHGTNRELIAEWSPTTLDGDTWAAVACSPPPRALLVGSAGSRGATSESRSGGLGRYSGW